MITTLKLLITQKKLIAKIIFLFFCSMILFGCRKKEEKKETQPTEKSEQIEEGEIMKNKTFTFLVNENMIKIIKFKDKDFEKIITKKPVRNLELNEDFLIFEEKINNFWNSKTINLNSYVNFLEKSQ